MKTEPSELESLAQQACHEIRDLRRRNEILSAKVEMINLFACVLHSKPAECSERCSPDVVWAIEKELAREKAAAANPETP
jgi:hypothetical protein